MGRLACVSIDLDSLPHYCRIHGLGEEVLPDGGATAVYRLAPQRFGELCESLGIRGTLFLVGHDLTGEVAPALRQATAVGFEMGNHTYWHDYQLARSSPAEIAADIARGAEAIEQLTGARPRGFRAPGYTFTAPMYQAICAQGYAYGSSVFPAAPYYLVKAAVLGARRLAGGSSAAMLDRPRVLRAPRVPYVPDPDEPYSRGPGKLPELPITVEPLTRFPFIGTFAATLPRPAALALYRSVSREPFLNLELHGVDLMDQSDGAGERLAAVQRDLRVPAKDKLARLRALLERIAGDYEVVTLLKASARVP